MLDKKDLRLMELQALNCRLSYATLSKALKISKDAVKYRLNNLLKDRFLTNRTIIIDNTRLGLRAHHLFLRLKRAYKEHFQRTISRIIKHKSVGFVSETSGKYDLQVIIYARDYLEAERFKNEICEENVQYYDMFSLIKEYKYNLLIPDTDLKTGYNKLTDSSFSKYMRDTRDLCYTSTNKKEKVDKKDIDILVQLNKNPCINLKELGEKVRLTGEGVKKRIISLIKRKIIIAFVANPNFSKFGYFSYCLLLKIKKDTPQIKQYMQSRDYIFFSNQLTNNRSIVYILAKDPRELQNYINDMREVLGENITGYEVLIHLDVHKYTHFPEIMHEIKE
jgi:DNA-binding Lrp family transcriptional regulator